MAREASDLVVVPKFVGLPVLEARSLASSAHLVLTSGTPDGPPLGAALTWPGRSVVTAQRPGAGASVPSGSWVVIDFINLGGGGGESGDREPRAPTPSAGALAVELREPEEP